MADFVFDSSMSGSLGRQYPELWSSYHRDTLGLTPNEYAAVWYKINLLPQGIRPPESFTDQALNQANEQAWNSRSATADPESYTERAMKFQQLLSNAIFLREQALKELPWFIDPLWSKIPPGSGPNPQPGQFRYGEESDPATWRDPVVDLLEKYGTTDREQYAEEQGYPRLPHQYNEQNFEYLQLYIANSPYINLLK